MSSISHERRPKPKPRLMHFSSCICLAAISNLHVAAASPGGGVLPPPPPPPPQERRAAVAVESSGLKDESIIAKPLESSAEKSDGEDAVRMEPKETVKITDSPLNPISDDTRGVAAKDSIWGASAGESAENDGSSSTMDAQQAGQPLQPLNDQQWANRQTQYSGQHYQQQWQQQSRAQQQYYEQQQYQQPYPSQYQNWPPQQQQPGQLAVYRRPAPTAPRKSASGLFSLAVKKLQTGIDTVSESFDANKVASSVSGITSRIGELGSNIAGGSGRAPPTRQRPNVGRNTAPGPRGPIRRGPGMGSQPPRQQGQYPQRMPPQRQRPKNEAYAPPINELFSLEAQRSNEEHGDGSDAADEHQLDEDATDVEDGVHPGVMMQREPPASKQPELTGSPPQSGPFPNDGQSQPFRAEKPRSIPPQSGGRTTQSPRPMQPSNRGSVNPSGSGNRRRYDDYDDDEGSSIGQKVISTLRACVPRVRVPRLFKGSDMTFDDGAWSDDEGSSGGGFFRGSSKAKEASFVSSSRGSSTKPAIVPRPVQSLLEKRETLLSPASAKKCASVGRGEAIIVAGQVALLVFTLQEVAPLFFSALSSANDAEGGGGGMRQALISTILSAMDGWAPLALAAAFLLSASNNVWIQPGLKSAYKEAAAENASDAAYAQLYLRLMSSLPMQKSFSTEVMMKTAQARAVQIASLARLRSFVAMAVLYVLLSTVAVLRPAGAAMMSAAADVARLMPRPVTSWRESDWKSVLGGVKNVAFSLAQELRTLIGTEWSIVREQPLRVAVVASLLLALVAVSALPSLEKGAPPLDIDIEEEEEDDTIISLWSNIGASSASRLGLLSSPRGVEGALEQFTKLRPDRAAAAGIALPGERPILAKKRRGRRRPGSPTLDVSTLQLFLKHVLYSASSLMLLSVPLLIYFYLLANTEEDGLIALSTKAIPETGWISLLELATLLVITHLQVGDAVHATLQANKVRLGRSVSTFFRKLADTVNEVQKLAAESSSAADFQAMLTASPSKGISVSDFWAAHASRRAWAVKGSNLQCQNGEVVLIIGVDGAGKSRLLTAIAERIFDPPKSARTTTYARGSVTVAGVDLTKWDRNQLQKRVGVFLNDVRTVSDYASLVSGCTLEEILEPVPSEGGRVGPKERNAMSVAMKITGIGSDLITRLPSKLSTVVSANEDELKPSALRPPSYPLSPEDWTRVLLTKILAQLLAGNENQLSSPGHVRKCAIGSILLLDDATSQMSEVNEAKFISALRSTGAAVLLTSSRWATGRFADRIVVVENGSVVESGTHADLINLGPDRSMYARQWSSMS